MLVEAYKELPMIRQLPHWGNTTDTDPLPLFKMTIFFVKYFFLLNREMFVFGHSFSNLSHI